MKNGISVNISKHFTVFSKWPSKLIMVVLNFRRLKEKNYYCFLVGLLPSLIMVLGCEYFCIIIIPPSFTLKMEEVSIFKCFNYQLRCLFLI